jgi:Ca-activated chloride channel family protein
MFTFQWPFLFLILPLPLLIRSLLPAKNDEPRSATPEIHFPHLDLLQNAFDSKAIPDKNKKPHWPWLFYCAWALLVLALMRPQIVDQIKSAKTDGRDLMLAVDLSGSMQSFDFVNEGEPLSRLDMAKKVVKDFVKKRAGDRIGLIVFGEHAYLQAPLTLDSKAVTQMLDNTVPGVAGDATAIGDAIGLAVKNLRKRPAQSRAIVLITDGEDNASTLPPLEAARLAKEYGIRIYTVVIGKEGSVPFPDGEGGLTMVESHVDTTLTRKIAEITGGEFYRAIDSNSLVQIYDQIDSLQKSESEHPPILIRKPLYEYPIGLALGLFGLLAIAAYRKGDSYEFYRI